MARRHLEEVPFARDDHVPGARRPARNDFMTIAVSPDALRGNTELYAKELAYHVASAGMEEGLPPALQPPLRQTGGEKRGPRQSELAKRRRMLA